MKKILITGGAGFIGSHLADALLKEQKCEITCLDNFDNFYDPNVKRNNSKHHLSNSRYTLIEGDICNKNFLFEQLPYSYDAIVHIAARAGVRPSILNPFIYEQVNIKGTLNLLEFAKEKKIKQFVFASSSSVYGINKNIPWNENDNVLLPISPYAATKVACELLGYTYAHLYGIRFLALRLFTVFGPRQRPDLAIHKFIKSILNNQPITLYGDGSTSRDYTYVNDVVQALLLAINYTGSNFEIINVSSNLSVSLLDLLHTIEEILGKKAIIDYQPDQPGDVPKTLGDISKAKKLLNYNPSTDLKEGITKFIEWYCAT